MKDHDCVQEARVARIERLTDENNRLLGELLQTDREFLRQIERIDKSLHENLERFTAHVNEGVGWRERVTKLEAIVTKASIEKLNTTKAAQWRIGILASSGTAILVKIIDIIARNL